MKFSRVPLDGAEGTLLAHSLHAKSGRLKKGHKLSVADVAALRAAGYSEVIAAILESGEVGENDAARRVAAAAAGRAVRLAPPFTGRCNLLAASRGITVMDRARVDRLNLVNEAVTIATLEPYAIVEDRQLIATVKVIPLGVPEGVLEACTAIAADDGPLVDIATFSEHAVGLLLTRLPGMREGILDKTSATLTTRLDALGSHVGKEIRCTHTEDEVAAAIDQLIAAGCSLVLIFGASATIDRRDVVPAGIVRAGGGIDRFGMPVDPGNLLLLAHHGEVSILSLPGSARSPRLNGFDHVLQRLLAGVPVSASDISRMGVGGLLKEMPGRPQPRERRPRAEVEQDRASAATADAGAHVAALVLAAGQSRRMGRTNKLLAKIDGVPMVARVVDSVLATRARPIVVVTGHEASRVRRALASRDVTFVHNADYDTGLSTSLVRGLAALGEGVEGALVCLGDMPRIKPHHLERLLTAFNPTEGRAICVPTHNGKRGNPVLWAAGYFAEMQKVAGDVGARHLLGEYADELCEVPVEDDAIFIDIDTPRSLKALNRRGAS